MSHDCKEHLVHLIVHRAFYPALMAFRTSPGRATFKLLQDVARTEIERLRRCRSVEDVFVSFKRDLGTKPDSADHPDLQLLHVPVFEDVHDDLERVVQELGFKRAGRPALTFSTMKTGAFSMDQNVISQRAYAIWESKGQPDGSHEEHWQQACREIEAGETIATSDSNAFPVDTPDLDKKPVEAAL